MKWDRHAVTNYPHLRTNKGNLRSGRYKIRKTDSPLCRYCNLEEETGDHLVFTCSELDRPSIVLDGIQRFWLSWEDIDSGTWVKEVKDKNGQHGRVDLAREFFAKLQLRTSDS